VAHDEGAKFLGKFQHSLDPKGRLILPSAHRDKLQEGLVMTMGLDGCVTVYPAQQWEQVVAELREMDSSDRRARGFVRMMMSSAHPDTLDRQGRVTVPSHLREYAGMDKDVTVVGADRRVELWDVKAWQRYQSETLADFMNTDQAYRLGSL
jgi:MraZ protein